MTHDQIKAAVRCPRCGSQAGYPCVENGRRLGAIHPARVMAAEVQGGWRERGQPWPASVAERARRRRAARYGRKR